MKAPLDRSRGGRKGVDPGAGTVFTGAQDGTAGVAGAANTFARASTVDGTIDISGLATGDIYFPIGTFSNGFSLTLTMTGSGADLAADYTVANGVIGNTNRGFMSEFSFTNEGQYDTINYEWRHLDIDGSRARFQGVMLDGAAAIPEPSGVALLGLAGFGFLFRRRR